MNTYGSPSLTETSPAQSFTEPLTLAEVKAYLNLPERSPADSAEDADLELMITAARDIAEGLQGRDLVRKQWDLYHDAFWSHKIRLSAPLVSVDLVQYTDSDGLATALVADTDYIVDTKKQPGLVMPAYGESWPSFTAWPSSAVLIRFTSGYESTDVFWSGDAGTRIKRGMLLLINHWFTGRLPFEPNMQSMNGIEYPFAVTACLSFGALTRVR